jgi:methyl-accepting chemotaxis protein
MIEEVIKNINEGNNLVKITAEQLEKITESSVKLSLIANEVAEASQEQANGIEQISTGLEQIEDVVQSNSASAEENAASSEELASQVKILKELVSYFTFTKTDLISDSEYKKSVVPFKEKDI